MSCKLLSMLSQIRILHWQAKSFAEHKALGKLYEALDPLVDRFVESYSGARRKVPTSKDLFSDPPSDYVSKIETIKQLDCMCDYLCDELPKSLKGHSDSSLLNIRDEMLGAIQRTRYLLSLS